jgi:hypothetical protein
VPNRDDGNSSEWVEWPTSPAEVYCSLWQQIDIYIFDETLFCLEVNSVQVYIYILHIICLGHTNKVMG